MSTVEPRGINRRLQFELTDSLTRRFWAGVNKQGDNDCWPWTGAIRSGYGAIKHEGKVLSTHVVAYRIHSGNVKPGRIITHTCDNKLCCNPDHLRLGTPASNVREMYARLSVRTIRGQLAPNAVLTDELARFILAAHALGAGRRSLADKLHVAVGTVNGVIDRKNWKHIEVPSTEDAEVIVDEYLQSTEAT